jgi:DNA-binding NarL/FixJ family response regulator
VAGRLTADERRLWRLIAAGAGTVDIALALHVSERTAKRLVAQLLRRLHVSSRVEAAALAGRVGLDQKAEG